MRPSLSFSRPFQVTAARPGEQAMTKGYVRAIKDRKPIRNDHRDRTEARLPRVDDKTRGVRKEYPREANVLPAPSFESGNDSAFERREWEACPRIDTSETIRISTETTPGPSCTAYIRIVLKPKSTKSVGTGCSGAPKAVPWSIDCPQTFFVRAFPLIGKLNWNRGLQIEDTSKTKSPDDVRGFIPSVRVGDGCRPGNREGFMGTRPDPFPERFGNERHGKGGRDSEYAPFPFMRTVEIRAKCRSLFDEVAAKQEP